MLAIIVKCFISYYGMQVAISTKKINFVKYYIRFTSFLRKQYNTRVHGVKIPQMDNNFSD